MKESTVGTRNALLRSLALWIFFTIRTIPGNTAMLESSMLMSGVLSAGLAVLLMALPSRAADKAPEREDLPTPCERGYCHYDEDGVLKLWGNLTTDDVLLIGSSSVQREQERYNGWVKNNRYRDDFPGLEFVAGPPFGWDVWKERLRAPSLIGASGRFNLRTLKITVYEEGARILQLWKRLQEHCAAEAATEDEPVCRQSVLRYHGEELPLPRLTERAAVLHRAFEVSLEFDDKVDNLSSRTTSRNTNLPERLRSDYLEPGSIPDGFFDSLAEIAERIDALIAKAELLEREDKSVYVDPFR